MIAHTLTFIPYGYEARLIDVEGGSSHGLPGFTIVGMANKSVSESAERVKNAIKSSGFKFPKDKVTINLAPAELHKDSTCLDLSIALSLLIISGQLRQADVTGRVFIGELSLDGHIRPVKAIINLVEAAQQAGFQEIFIPSNNASQAALINGITIYPIATLNEVFLHLKHQKLLSPFKRPSVVKNTGTDENTVLLEHIKGQDLAKRALAIAIAGHHNILMSGPPGTGKSLLARSALSLLPDLNTDEQISVTKIHDLSDFSNKIITTRPFRSPHHSITRSSLIGGGAKIKPGEISLAHLGILFLDELPEFSRQSLESLRQPLEDRRISLSRINDQCTYPCDFILIATMNPCPCGFYGDPYHPCVCTATEIKNYQHKISGPLLDRIDLHINVDRIKSSDLIDSPVSIPTSTSSNSTLNPALRSLSPASSKAPPPVSALTTNVVKNTISLAIGRQQARYHSQTLSNGNLSPTEISKYISLSPQVKSLLSSACDKLNLSTRSYFKIIKIARTIADLEGTANILPDHVAEALTYRRVEHIT